MFVVEIILLYSLARKVQIGFGRFFYKLTKSEKQSSYLLAVFFLPGTFVHEMAHFLTALFLLVPVGQIELMPEIIEGKGVKLGSVPIGKTDIFRRALVGFAPIIFGVGIILAMLSISVSNNYLENSWVTALIIYLIFEIGNTMFMSKRDLEGAWKLLIVVIFIIAIFYFIGFRFDPVSFNNLFSESVTEVFKTGDLFLAVPIAINVVLVGMFKSLKLL